MPTNLYGLVGYDRVKNNPLSDWRAYLIPDQHPLYPRCIPDAPTLKTRSARPIPDVTTLTTLNIGPTPDLYAWFPLPASDE